MQAIEKAKKEIIDLVEKAGFAKAEIEVETPPENVGADFSVPVFRLAAKKKINPQVLAEKIVDKINLENSVFSKVERAGAYINFYLDYKKFNKLVFDEFNSHIGCETGTVVIDYSSPNIAKPFSVGHLRSTVIGQALYNIYKFLGYKVIGDNHLGDWGTQFGKLICAYKKWGDESKLKKDPMAESLRIYVKFHEEAKNDKKLEVEAREWFKKLESGDKEALEIWKLFRNLSLSEFKKIYQMLGVKFDEELGESFYQGKTTEIIALAKRKKIAKWALALDEDGKPSTANEKVLIIDLKKYGIDTPLLLEKSDGTTLYATRDLAAIKYRLGKWKPEKILYVVGAEQKLYFTQLFKAAEILGFKSKFEHIYFGLIRLSGGKMSTREGKVIFLKDVLNEATKKVGHILNDRDMNKTEKDEVSKIVGIGAIKYADLSQSRAKDIVFDWNKIITLKGNSGPYLQYQYVRIQSILKKSKSRNKDKVNPELLNSSEEIKLIKMLAGFNETLEKVISNSETHILTDYLFNLSESFSAFYEKYSVLKASSSDLIATRLYLCQIVSQILKTGLNLLGINLPNKM